MRLAVAGLLLPIAVVTAYSPVDSGLSALSPALRGASLNASSFVELEVLRGRTPELAASCVEKIKAAVADPIVYTVGEGWSDWGARFENALAVTTEERAWVMRVSDPIHPTLAQNQFRRFQQDPKPFVCELPARRRSEVLRGLGCDPVADPCATEAAAAVVVNPHPTDPTMYSFRSSLRARAGDPSAFRPALPGDAITASAGLICGQLTYPFGGGVGNVDVGLKAEVAMSGGVMKGRLTFLGGVTIRLPFGRLSIGLEGSAEAASKSATNPAQLGRQFIVDLVRHVVVGGDDSGYTTSAKAASAARLEMQEMIATKATEQMPQHLVPVDAMGNVNWAAEFFARDRFARDVAFEATVMHERFLKQLRLTVQSSLLATRLTLGSPSDPASLISWMNACSRAGASSATCTPRESKFLHEIATGLTQLVTVITAAMEATMFKRPDASAPTTVFPQVGAAPKGSHFDEVLKLFGMLKARFPTYTWATLDNNRLCTSSGGCSNPISPHVAAVLNDWLIRVKAIADAASAAIKPPPGTAVDAFAHHALVREAILLLTELLALPDLDSELVTIPYASLAALRCFTAAGDRCDKAISSLSHVFRDAMAFAKEKTLQWIQEEIGNARLEWEASFRVRFTLSLASSTKNQGAFCSDNSRSLTVLGEGGLLRSPVMSVQRPDQENVLSPKVTGFMGFEANLALALPDRPSGSIAFRVRMGPIETTFTREYKLTLSGGSGTRFVDLAKAMIKAASTASDQTVDNIAEGLSSNALPFKVLDKLPSVLSKGGGAPTSQDERDRFVGVVEAISKAGKVDKQKLANLVQTILDAYTLLQSSLTGAETVLTVTFVSIYASNAVTQSYCTATLASTRVAETPGAIASKGFGFKGKIQAGKILDITQAAAYNPTEILPAWTSTAALN